MAELEFASAARVPDSGYELESAISSTAEVAKGQSGLTEVILQDHLKSLCALQYARLTGFSEE